ncbi:hypothetical protein NHH03_20590 [Stieleria sp. TO1_6]|uniref:Kelch repeat-containing protein n=1 Tax=Stieleria tagensis TaxID=2956795 RepID=UPI00209B29B7|nr:kelch repeat-containing protein [Stieleria tagensis]MCO8124154.1 hypothetical protein [Stieleria tagensis]
MSRIWKRLTVAAAALTALVLIAGSTAHAHFAWLATNAQGHAEVWFGESGEDHTYPMPKTIHSIELHSDGTAPAIEMKPVELENLVGLQSAAPVDSKAKITGSVTYGLYHGTKLTYHVEHLPQSDPANWPTQPRENAALQTVIQQTADGSLTVNVLRDGKPLAKTDVKLFDHQGQEADDQQTDEAGTVTFAADKLSPGLNALLVGWSDEDAPGKYQGEAYGGTTDYLTATFRIGKPSEPGVSKPAAKKPQVDVNSGASIKPAGLPDLPEELTSFGAAVAGDELFVYGGHTGNAHSYSSQEQSDRLWSLKLNSNDDTAWQTRSTGPLLQGLALVAYQDQLIRIGGFTARNEPGQDHDLHSQTAVASFNPKTDQWTDLAPLPEGRSSTDAAVLGDRVYVFGGWKMSGDQENQWHQSAYSLDLSDPSANWQPTAQPPFQRRAVSVAAHQGKLFVIGGMQPDNKPTTRVDVYSPDDDTWTQGPSIPGSGMSGFGSSSFATGGHLYVSTMDGFVHRLDPSGDRWTTIAAIDPPRFFHRMLPRGEKQLLLIGGANMEIGKFTAIDAIDLADNH